MNLSVPEIVTITSGAISLLIAVWKVALSSGKILETLIAIRRDMAAMQTDITHNTERLDSHETTLSRHAERLSVVETRTRP